MPHVPGIGGFVGQMAEEESELPSLTYLSAVLGASGVSSVANVPFGALGKPASARRVIACLGWQSAAQVTPTAVTIGGVAATIHAHHFVVATRGICVASALVPTGTSGTVAMTASAAVTWLGCASYRLIGVKNSAPTVVSNSPGGNTLNFTINRPANAALLAHWQGTSNTAVYTWTSPVPKKYDLATGNTMLTGASSDFAAAANAAYPIQASANFGGSGVAIALAWA